LPFLRFSRDKRGYEITCLMHTFRRRGNARSRILYCFRTPPGVRVGRAALDEEAIRAIEEHNRDLEFDWEQILRTQASPVVETPGGQRSGGPGDRRTGRGARGEAVRGEPDQRRRREAAAAPAVPGPPASSAASQPTLPEETATVVLRQGAPDDSPEPDMLTGPGEPDAEPVDERVDEAADEGAGGTADGDVARDPVAPDEPARPLGRVLSSEDLARLRARFAEILARITERAPDPARLEQLRTQAERLDPDTWVTEDEIRQALEHYEAVYHSLRSVLGPRRRRARWRGHRTDEGSAAPARQQPAAGEAASDEDGGQEKH
jgi:hypothetical protein